MYDASGATVLYSVRFKMDWQPRCIPLWPSLHQGRRATARPCRMNPLGSRWLQAVGLARVHMACQVCSSSGGGEGDSSIAPRVEESLERRTSVCTRKSQPAFSLSRHGSPPAPASDPRSPRMDATPTSRTHLPPGHLGPSPTSVHLRALVYSGDPEFKLFSSKTKDGTQPMWDMSANKAWSDRKLNIRSAADGRLVAESKENRWNLGGLVGQNEYGVSVAEGADAALVCVLIMMMDESAENNS